MEDTKEIDELLAKTQKENKITETVKRCFDKLMHITNKQKQEIAELKAEQEAFNNLPVDWILKNMGDAQSHSKDTGDFVYTIPVIKHKRGMLPLVYGMLTILSKANLEIENKTLTIEEYQKSQFHFQGMKQNFDKLSSEITDLLRTQWQHMVTNGNQQYPQVTNGTQRTPHS